MASHFFNAISATAFLAFLYAASSELSPFAGLTKDVLGQVTLTGAYNDVDTGNVRASDTAATATKVERLREVRMLQVRKRYVHTQYIQKPKSINTVQRQRQQTEIDNKRTTGI